MATKIPQSKKDQVALWEKRLVGNPSLVVFKYAGLRAGDMAQLRRLVREAGCRVGIVKNSLLRRALKGTAMEALGPRLKGTVATAVSGADPTAAARVLVKYAKDNEKCTIVAGTLGGSILDPAGVEALSNAPTIGEVRSTFLGLLQAVPGKFVRVLDAIPGGFVRVLSARMQSMESGEKAA